MILNHDQVTKTAPESPDCHTMAKKGNETQKIWVSVVATVAEWYRHRIVAGFVTSSSPVPLKTRRVGQRCTLNLSRAEMSSRWCGS
ncbi:hypothetical protein TNCV_3027061 [Trichonephila clavipes]|nr:hypothetical protein TNCV_3027061 [Trichonephila clavipes]